MLAIYKPGQGFYTRTCSAVGLALLALIGVAWLVKMFSGMKFLGRYEPIYTQAAIATLVLGFLAALAYWLLGTKPRSVDFLIATEGEMKKVNWSTRREVMGSTALVIGFTFVLALLCFTFDFLFQVFFQWIHVLEAA